MMRNHVFTFNLIIWMESYIESNKAISQCYLLLCSEETHLSFFPILLSLSSFLWLSQDQPSFQREVGIQVTFIFGGQSNRMCFLLWCSSLLSRFSSYWYPLNEGWLFLSQKGSWYKNFKIENLHAGNLYLANLTTNQFFIL
jgi:hypothetical protein